MPISLVRLLSTFFYIGKLPFATGSIASLLTLLACIYLYRFPVAHVLTILIVIALGFLSSGRMEEITKEKDPSCIVIDEVAGMLIACFMIPVHHFSIAITTFFLFRAFDMFEIYPVNQLVNMKDGRGVMMDDIVAGLYTNITMHISLFFVGLIKF